MTALQFLADSSANDAIREKLREFPNRVYFPNFGKGDNIFKEGIDIDRVLFTVPGTNFKIYWYGFLITIGILLAMIYGFRRMKTVGIDPDRATDAVIGGLIGAIFGARFYYIIFNTEGMKFSEFFDIRDGGLAIYGGIIGAILVGGIIAKIRKLKLTALLDVVAPCFLIGQCIGRWGNFINVEAFGGNTGLPWGMSSPTIVSYLTQHEAELEAIGMNIDPNMPVHPTFLYESLWCLLGFVLIAWYTKRRRFDGELTLLYTAWYGAGRAVIEGLRTDSLMIPGTSLRASQVLAFVLVVAAVILWVVKSVQLKKTGKTQLYVDTEEGQLVVSGQFYQKKNKEQPQVEENFPGNGEPADALSETEEIADEPQPQEEAQSGETAAKESQPEEAADTEDKQQ